jgi:hypothetical protein
MTDGRKSEITVLEDNGLAVREEDHMLEMGRAT